MKPSSMARAEIGPGWGFLGGVSALALCLEVWMAVLLLPHALGGSLDFPAYYRAGMAVRTVPSTLYDKVASTPFIHPAYEALAFVPFSFFPYRTAYIGFAGLNIVLLLGIWRILKLPWELAAFAPLSIAIVFGQDSIVFLSLLAAAWLAARRQRDLACGLFLGLALFRFQNLLAIFLLLLMWREWRVIKGAALSGTIVVLVSMLIASPGRYVALLRNVSTSGGHGAYSQIIARMVGLRGLIGSTLPNYEPWLLPMACVAVIALCAWLGWSEDLDHRLKLSVLAACLVSFHIYPHDLTVLIVPMADSLRNKRIHVICFAIAASMLALFNYRLYLLSLLTAVMIGLELRWKWHLYVASQRSLRALVG